MSVIVHDQVNFTDIQPLLRNARCDKHVEVPLEEIPNDLLLLLLGHAFRFVGAAAASISLALVRALRRAFSLADETPRPNPLDLRQALYNLLRQRRVTKLARYMCAWGLGVVECIGSRILRFKKKVKPGHYPCSARRQWREYCSRRC